MDKHQHKCVNVMLTQKPVRLKSPTLSLPTISSHNNRAAEHTHTDTDGPSLCQTLWLYFPVFTQLTSTTRQTVLLDTRDSETCWNGRAKDNNPRLNDWSVQQWFLQFCFSHTHILTHKSCLSLREIKVQNLSSNSRPILLLKHLLSWNVFTSSYEATHC